MPPRAPRPVAKPKQSKSHPTAAQAKNVQKMSASLQNAARVQARSLSGDAVRRVGNAERTQILAEVRRPVQTPPRPEQASQSGTRPAAQKTSNTVKRANAPQQQINTLMRPAAHQIPAGTSNASVKRPTGQAIGGHESQAAPRPVNRPSPERIISPEMQRRRETVNAYKYENTDKKVKKSFKPLKLIAYGLSFVLTFAVILVVTVFVCLKMICGDTSPAAKELLVTTLLETGQMKDVASWFLSAEEIQKIVDDNTMSSFENDIDSSLITIDKTPDSNEQGEEQKDIEVVEISGRTFFGTLLIIKDPSRVELSTIYPWAEEGVPLDKLVKDAGAVAGINGGLYNSTNNSGGKPYGVIVCKGEIQFNEPQQFPGLVLIGFTEDSILEIIPIDGYSKQDVIDLVAEKKIRDAVTFQEESSDKNNHFVQLVINGEARDMNGMGSGLNPRTAIGQRADGSVLLLVTDGRGKSGHLGASASDLINVMVEYGAVNAANLDGGSSSCMYYKDEYLMTSVTFYYSNSSWKLPAAFVVK